MFQMRDSGAKRTSWRQAMVMGLAIGMSVAVGRSMQEAMMPSWGYGMTLAASAMAAATVGGLVALMGMMLMRMR